VVIVVDIGDIKNLAVDGERAAGAAATPFGWYAQARKMRLGKPNIVGPELLLTKSWLLREQREVAGEWCACKTDSDYC
jgi:hypothetical protein